MIAGRFLAAVWSVNGNPNDLLVFYDPSIFETKSRERWLAELQGAATSLGSYKSHRLLVAQTREGILDKSAGSAVTLTYSVQYERSSATAVFTLRVPSGGKEARIIAHSVTFQPIKQ